jgi:hypothetical protein
MSALTGAGLGAVAVLASAGSTDQAGTYITVGFVVVVLVLIALAVRQLRRVPGKFDPTLQDRPRRGRHHGDGPAAPDDPDRGA